MPKLSFCSCVTKLQQWVPPGRFGQIVIIGDELKAQYLHNQVNVDEFHDLQGEAR
jgi:hypothetical protein